MSTPRVINKRRENAAAYAPNSVDVMRPSRWGNPYRIGVHGDRAQVIALYRAWLHSSPARLAAARVELRGRDLVCCCAPLACHADVLLEAANANDWATLQAEEQARLERERSANLDVGP